MDYVPSNRERSYLRAATRAARRNPNARTYRFGAVVVNRSRIVALAHNYPDKTHPISYPVGIHAEMHGCLRAGDKSRGATIYVVRLTPRGEEAMSRPCPRCVRVLKRYGVRSVIYSYGGNRYRREEIEQSV